MLTVKTIQETKKLLLEKFGTLQTKSESVPTLNGLGRIMAEAVVSDEFIPGFNRSTVDGFAVKAADIQGSSDSIPAILTCVGEIHMGEAADLVIHSNECAMVPTGGEVPQGADTVVMLEYVEAIGSQQYAFYKPSAPGSNMILRGEDGKPGDVIIPQGKNLTAADIATLSAAGFSEVCVSRKPKVGIISTGDELVSVGEPLKPGQIRDVNQSLLSALVVQAGGQATFYGIVKDKVEVLSDLLCRVIEQSDIVLVSGGTSVGEKDAMAQALQILGQIYVHGIAVKPGKPTLVGEISGKPVFGLPGNPVACFFVFHAIVEGLIHKMLGAEESDLVIEAKLSRAVASNHGREEFILVNLKDGLAEPVPSKSGLISTVSKSNGYFVIPRETEGLAAGTTVAVHMI
ncbi:MAG: gephyrin-like molybdotransferase Glp [Anaerolineaceae bacterium]